VHTPLNMALNRLRQLQRLPIPSLSRPFTSTRLARSDKLMGEEGEPPKSNKPDPSDNSSAAPNRNMRSDEDTLNTDHKSSASQEEHKTGDDHPAKQPDPQAKPTRSTGIGGNEAVG
jgi:hypothetical protein